jgi:hypothetical protein
MLCFVTGVTNSMKRHRFSVCVTPSYEINEKAIKAPSRIHMAYLYFKTLFNVTFVRFRPCDLTSHPPKLDANQPRILTNSSVTTGNNIY